MADEVPVLWVDRHAGVRMSEYPASVYEFGAWLRAHPAVKRVKLDNDTFRRYMTEVELSARYLSEAAVFHPVLMWRGVQAIIPASDWHRREWLFPVSRWRKGAA